MTTPVWIGLGSNLGDRKATLDAAIAALTDEPEVVVEAVSSYHETKPVGGPIGQGAFLNAASRLRTTLGPFELLAVTQRIENQLGRVRSIRWGERTLDVDLLIFGAKFLDTKELKLPHPRLPFRRFVLGPLAEIAPSIVDTTSRRTIADLLARLDVIPGRIAIHGPAGPSKSSLFDRLVETLPAAGVRVDRLDTETAAVVDDPKFVIDQLRCKLDVLSGELWRGPRSRNRWVVADYCMAFDLLRPGSIPGIFSSNRGGTRDLIREWKHLREAARRALSPIVTVVLPGTTEVRRTPGLANFPILWPDAVDIDAIVEEVLATCRAIEDGWPAAERPIEPVHRERKGE